jgi:hypothetical protein
MYVYTSIKITRVCPSVAVYRAKKTGGRFIPVSSKPNLSFAPLGFTHDLISPSKHDSNVLRFKHMQNAAAALRKKNNVAFTEVPLSSLVLPLNSGWNQHA